jgi:hypothetical protein
MVGPLHEIRISRGKGQGQFAVTNIAAGTSIFGEKPLLAKEIATPIEIYRQFRSASVTQKKF